MFLGTEGACSLPREEGPSSLSLWDGRPAPSPHSDTRGHLPSVGTGERDHRCVPEPRQGPTQRVC